jgi:hypothetical protein
MRMLAFVLLTALVAPCARAADLQVVLHNAKGQPVRDAVVTYYPQGGAGSGPIRFDWPYRMAQQNLQFDPFVLVVPAGATVAFPNHDQVRHQVYSFSPAKPFELKLYGRDETRTIKFDRVGVIALGCNIHDSMVAFIKVVDTPFAAKTDAQGVAVLHGAPAGPGALKIWHPYMKAPGNELSEQVSAPQGGVLRRVETVDIRSPPIRRNSY